MPLDIIIGTQWGDEGKGRVVDLLSEGAAMVARYNGGDNAGHTVTVGERTFKLHLLPSGMIHPQTVGVLGNGMVVNPATLLEEMDTLRRSGIEVNERRLRISFAAHLITPAHKALDLAQEKARGGGQIGTTGRGIGPAYTDRAARRGLRAGEMLDLKGFRKRFLEHIQETNRWLAGVYGGGELDARVLADEYLEYAEHLTPYITDVSREVTGALKAGKRVLAEGAQGTLLDLDFGTYPFVTSSNPIASGALVGLGLGPQNQTSVIGVTKAFQSRVGAGPFPSEVFDEMAVRLRGTGSNPWDEFGTTTGRPRRVGWLDGVLLRYAVRVNGVTRLALTKLDVLSGLPEIKVCMAYRDGGKEYADLPHGPAALEPFTAVYETLPGWQEDISAAREWMDLPEAARSYIRYLEKITGVPVSLASVGAERSQVVRLPVNSDE